MTSETSPRQKRVDRFLRAANIGTIAMLAYPALAIALEYTLIDYQDGDNIVWPLLTTLVAILFLICESFSIISTFRNRNADEFTLAMWQSGTNFAFFAAILWLLVGGYVEALFDGIAVGQQYQDALAAGNEDFTPLEGIGIIERFATPVVVGAFFVGLQTKRFRG